MTAASQSPLFRFSSRTSIELRITSCVSIPGSSIIPSSSGGMQSFLFCDTTSLNELIPVLAPAFNTMNDARLAVYDAPEMYRKKEKPRTMSLVLHLSTTNWLPAKYPIADVQKPLTSPTGCGNSSSSSKSSVDWCVVTHIRTAHSANITRTSPQTVQVKGANTSTRFLALKSSAIVAFVTSLKTLMSRGDVKSTWSLRGAVSQKDPTHKSTLPR
mmetsp:Transcript_8304/g.19402  ORF Transcript_8304/g.19402 Transcript_8304/m.19402 type:complete len:214 (+) Transcript_8304:664-1305(+)